MSAVAAPADRRFRRAHVKPSRKRRAWTRRALPLAGALVVLAVLGAGGYRAAKMVRRAPIFLVNRITVKGNERLAAGEVLALLGGLRGESLLWTDLEAWRRQLLGSPWIRDASLRRALPSRVDVTIEERQPIAVGRMGGDMYLIDDTGAVIDQFGPEYADLDLPIVDGLRAGDDEPKAGVPSESGELAARVVTSLRSAPDIARRVSQIDVSDPHNVEVILTGDSAAIGLGDDQFLPRLQSYLELAPALRERVPDIDHVDARFDGRIYVRPGGQPAKNRSSGAAEGRTARRSTAETRRQRGT